MNLDKDFEIMKGFEEFPIKGDKRLSIKAKKGLRILIKDSKRGYVSGEIKYIEKNKNFYYSRKDNGEKVKLFYSNLERIFINNKKD